VTRHFRPLTSDKFRQSPPNSANRRQSSTGTCPAPAARAFLRLRTVPAPKERTCPTSFQPSAISLQPGDRFLVLVPLPPSLRRFVAAPFGPTRYSQLPISANRRATPPESAKRPKIANRGGSIFEKSGNLRLAGSKTGFRLPRLPNGAVRPPPLETVGHPASVPRSPGATEPARLEPVRAGDSPALLRGLATASLRHGGTDATETRRCRCSWYSRCAALAFSRRCERRSLSER
jgi:hypothetical protein